ncbi:MAG: helix-turn-helix transcriptional regulator, partial [Elusimicrobiaceae bacterium]|nr:helix-turn-helix transcriptional regulator [Elusimicrobiaceae bacterium]
MGLSGKKHSIGKTIATLRKEKGWTQVELAEKLQVSDKAVSKWEKDDSSPSVEFFPALADLFGVSIDYLMTGKKDEQPFTLDDLDSLKRAVYLVEKDDLSNFEKYGYVNGDILLSETKIDRRTSSRENSTIRKAVVEHQSVKIFGALATDFLEKLRHGGYDYLIVGYSTPVAKLVYDYLGDFIKLCALSNHIDIFDYFKSKYYRSENRYCKETNVMNNISTEILDFIFTDPRVPQEVIDYFVQYEDESHKNPWICREGELVRFDPNRTKYQVLHSLYNSKRFDLLDAYMDKMRQEAQATFNKFDNPSPVWNWEEGYLYSFPSRENGNYCYYDCIGRMITAPTHLAIEHKDKAMALKFNEYNAFIKSLADKLLKKGYGGVFKDEKAIDEAIEKVKAEERYQAILSDDTITEYNRRRKLFAIHALHISSTIEADDYDLFAQFPFEETKDLTISAVAKCCKDIRFYIYAVGLGQPQDKLND